MFPIGSDPLWPFTPDHLFDVLIEVVLGIALQEDCALDPHASTENERGIRLQGRVCNLSNEGFQVTRNRQDRCQPRPFIKVSIALCPVLHGRWNTQVARCVRKYPSSWITSREGLGGIARVFLRSGMSPKHTIQLSMMALEEAPGERIAVEQNGSIEWHVG